MLYQQARTGSDSSGAKMAQEKLLSTASCSVAGQPLQMYL
jgi:hypothetical protein